MTGKTRQRETAMVKRPISITAVVDAVGVLSSGSTHGHLYMYDTNKAGGSLGLGSEALRTKVSRGDELLWGCLALECEAFVAIEDVVIDPTVCEPERRVYPGTDVSYWIGTVKKDTAEPVPYRIKFLVGTRVEPITSTSTPMLIG